MRWPRYLARIRRVVGITRCDTQCVMSVGSNVVVALSERWLTSTKGVRGRTGSTARGFLEILDRSLCGIGMAGLKMGIPLGSTYYTAPYVRGLA